MKVPVCGRCHAEITEQMPFGGIEVSKPVERYAVDLCVPCLDLLETWLRAGVAKPEQGLAYVALGEFGEIWLYPTSALASELAVKYGDSIVAAVERRDFLNMASTDYTWFDYREPEFRLLQIALNAAKEDPTRNFYVPREEEP